MSTKLVPTVWLSYTVKEQLCRARAFTSLKSRLSIHSILASVVQFYLRVIFCEHISRTFPRNSHVDSVYLLSTIREHFVFITIKDVLINFRARQRCLFFEVKHRGAKYLTSLFKRYFFLHRYIHTCEMAMSGGGARWRAGGPWRQRETRLHRGDEPVAPERERGHRWQRERRDAKPGQTG